MTTSTLSRLLLGLSVVTSLALGIIVINTSPDDDGALDASVALGDAAGASPSSSASDASTDPMDDHQTGMLSLPPGSPEIPPDPEVEKVTGSAKKETTTSEPESKPDDPTTTSPVAPATTKPEGRSLSGPVVVGGESGVVVAGLVISNPDGPCVRISGSVDVVVRDSEIGPCGGRAVEVEDSSGVSLEGLEIHDSASGVYAVNSESVVVADSVFSNAGRNFVQFDKVSGPGNRISGNSGGNVLGGSDAEDFISVYRSSGTSSSPLRVVDNSFRNGGPSVSGSGIMVGDAGGSHIVVEANTLIDPGQVGIGVPGGTGIRVLRNVVYSAAHPWSNVGIYVWNQSGGPCGSIEVKGNRVEWYNADGSERPSWDGGNCGEVAGWDDNDWHSDIGLQRGLLSDADRGP